MISKRNLYGFTSDKSIINLNIWKHIIYRLAEVLGDTKKRKKKGKRQNILMKLFDRFSWNIKIWKEKNFKLR